MPSDFFFSQLWEFTVDGFFSDPVYVFYLFMVSWLLIFFPFAYSSYYYLVYQHFFSLYLAAF